MRRPSSAGTTRVRGAANTAVEVADNLAWLFYKDGVREVTLARASRRTSSSSFLEHHPARAQRRRPTKTTCSRCCGRRTSRILTYRYVDLAPDGRHGARARPTARRSPASSGCARARSTGARRARRRRRIARRGIVNMADFDATLYFLDEQEIEYLHREIRARVRRRISARTSSRLAARHLRAADGSRHPQRGGRRPADASCCTCSPRGHFRGVADPAARGADGARARAGRHGRRSATRSRSSPERLSAPDALSQLLQSLDEASTLPPQDELAELFDQLRPTALATVFHLAGEDAEREAATAARSGGRATRRPANTAELVRLIQRAGTRGVVGSDPSRRRAQGAGGRARAEQGAGEPDVSAGSLPCRRSPRSASPGALQALERAIEDADRDVRITAVRALASRSVSTGARAARDGREGQGDPRRRPHREDGVLRGYGTLCGDAGVSHSRRACSTARDSSAAKKTRRFAPAPRSRSGGSARRKRTRRCGRRRRREGRRRAQRRDARAAGRGGAVVTTPRTPSRPSVRRDAARGRRRRATSYVRRAGRATHLRAVRRAARDQAVPGRERGRPEGARRGDAPDAEELARRRGRARAPDVGRVHLRELDAPAPRPRQLREL